MLLAAVVTIITLAPLAHRRLDDWRRQRRVERWRDFIRDVYVASPVGLKDADAPVSRDELERDWARLAAALDRPSREQAALPRGDPELDATVGRVFEVASQRAGWISLRYGGRELPPLLDAAEVAAVLGPVLDDPARFERRATTYMLALLRHAAPADAATLRRMADLWPTAGTQTRIAFLHAADGALDAHPRAAVTLFDRALDDGAASDLQVFFAAKNAIGRRLIGPRHLRSPALTRLFLHRLATGHLGGWTDDTFDRYPLHPACDRLAAPEVAVRAAVRGLDVPGHTLARIEFALRFPEAARPFLPQLRRAAAEHAGSGGAWSWRYQTLVDRIDGLQVDSPA